MNKVILMGRATKDPDVRYSNASGTQTAIAKYSLAVDRIKRQGEEQTADFISITAFGKAGEFAEKYVKKGTKLLVSGRLQTGKYTNKDGQTIYTTDVIAESQEFCESKGSSAEPDPNASTTNGGFMNIPEGVDEDLPFACPNR